MIIVVFILAIIIAYLLIYYLNVSIALDVFQRALPYLKSGWVIMPYRNYYEVIMIPEFKFAFIITKSQFKVFKRFLRYHKDGNYYALN